MVFDETGQERCGDPIEARAVSRMGAAASTPKNAPADAYVAGPAAVPAAPTPQDPSVIVSNSFSSDTLFSGVGGDLAEMGNFKWCGAVAAADGCIYAVPSNASKVLRIDPVAKTATAFGDDLAAFGRNNKWNGGTLGPDGCIYCVPCSAPHVLRIDPFNGTTTAVGEDLSSFGNSGKWYGSALGPDGMIYCAPSEASKVLRIDPSTQTVAVIGDDLSSYGTLGKWAGAACGTDGAIYCAPCNAACVLRIDTRRQNAAGIAADDLVEVAADTGKWTGAVLGPNGYIYCAPRNATRVLRIDPVCQSASFIGGNMAELGTNKYFDAVFAPDGCIYCAPSRGLQVLRIHPATGGTELVGIDLSKYGAANVEKWRGITMSFDGCMYMTPFKATSVLRIEIQPSMPRVHQLLQQAPQALTQGLMSHASLRKLVSHGWTKMLASPTASSTVTDCIAICGPALVLITAIGACAPALVTRLLDGGVPIDGSAQEMLTSSDAAAWKEFVLDGTCAMPADRIITMAPVLASPALVAAISNRASAITTRLAELGACLSDQAVDNFLTNDARVWQAFASDGLCATAVSRVVMASPLLAPPAMIAAVSQTNPRHATNLLERGVRVTKEVEDAMISSGFWHELVTKDESAAAVKMVASQAKDIMSKKDKEGRIALDSASEAVRQVIKAIPLVPLVCVVSLTVLRYTLFPESRHGRLDWQRDR